MKPSDLLIGLQLIEKYRHPRDHAYIDIEWPSIIITGVSSMSEEDRERLHELGFYSDDEDWAPWYINI